MSKKFFIPIAVALILAMVIGGAAFAAEAQHPETVEIAGINGYGQITALGSSQFTVRNGKGEHTIQVDANTRFLAPGGEARSFSDLKVGNWVIGRVNRDQKSQALVARQVILLPDGFEPSKINMKAAGRVTAVDLAAGTITIHTLKNGDKTFSVDANTVFLGVKSLSDIHVGMGAAIGAQDQGNGKLLAVIVGAREPLTRNIGRILSIDTAASTFTVHTAKGDELTFLVDANTNITGLDQNIKGLGDLKPGMRVLVASKMDANGNRVAMNVTAAALGRLSRFELILGGQIGSTGQNSFTLRTPNHREQTFQVAGTTRFRQLGKGSVDFSSLQTGMRALVGAKDLGNGQFLAQFVLVTGATQ